MMLSTCQVKSTRELKRSSQISSPLCFLFTAGAVSGLHKSVYFSETCILVCSSLSAHVRHSAHQEFKKLHLEQSFTIYWNACCGWKLSLCAGK